MKRVRGIITGDVVGVGFRSWVKRQAAALGVTGWVKNREDDSVEVVAEGPPDALTTLISRCHTGPDVSWVKDVAVSWQGATGEFVTFEVVY